MMLRKVTTALALLAILAIPAGGQGTAPKAGGATKAAPTATAAPAAAQKAAPKAAAAPIDINTATKEQLMAVKGIGEAYSAKIIAGRPYKSKDELWRRKIMPKGAYNGAKEMLIATQPPKK